APPTLCPRFFFQAEDGIRDRNVTGVQTCALPISFWQADRHRKAVYTQFTGGTTPFDFTKNYKFTILNNENVWAKAMNRVVSEKEIGRASCRERVRTWAVSGAIERKEAASGAETKR